MDMNTAKAMYEMYNNAGVSHGFNPMVSGIQDLMGRFGAFDRSVASKVPAELQSFLPQMGFTGEELLKKMIGQKNSLDDGSFYEKRNAMINQNHSPIQQTMWALLAPGMFGRQKIAEEVSAEVPTILKAFTNPSRWKSPQQFNYLAKHPYYQTIAKQFETAGLDMAGRAATNEMQNGIANMSGAERFVRPENLQNGLSELGKLFENAMKAQSK